MASALQLPENKSPFSSDHQNNLMDDLQFYVLFNRISAHWLTA